MSIFGSNPSDLEDERHRRNPNFLFEHRHNSKGRYEKCRYKLWPTLWCPGNFIETTELHFRQQKIILIHSSCFTYFSVCVCMCVSACVFLSLFLFVSFYLRIWNNMWNVLDTTHLQWPLNFFNGNNTLKRVMWTYAYTMNENRSNRAIKCARACVSVCVCVWEYKLNTKLKKKYVALLKDGICLYQFSKDLRILRFVLFDEDVVVIVVANAVVVPTERLTFTYT